MVLSNKSSNVLQSRKVAVKAIISKIPNLAFPMIWTFPQMVGVVRGFSHGRIDRFASRFVSGK